MYPICYPFYHEVSARQEVWQRLSVLRATQVKIRSKTQLFLEGGQLLQVDRPTTTSFQEDSSSREFVRLQKCNLLTEGFSCLLRLLLYIVRYVIVHYVIVHYVIVHYVIVHYVIVHYVIVHYVQPSACGVFFFGDPMYEIIVMVVVFFVVAFSSWWLEEFDEPWGEHAAEDQGQAAHSLQEQRPTVSRRAVGGDS